MTVECLTLPASLQAPFVGALDPLLLDIKHSDPHAARRVFSARGLKAT